MRERHIVLVSMVGAVCAGTLVSCTSPAGKMEKTAGVTEATSAYAAGHRGALPPACEGYTVLGVTEGIKNWVIRYDDVLIRGGEFYNDKAADALKAWGVKTIISISPSDRERQFSQKYGFVLVELPFDKKQGPTSADMRQFLNTIKTGQGPFYVHCIGGTHRGGALGLAYRVHVLGWTWERALIEFGRLGGSLKDDHAMLEAVRTYTP